MLTRQTRDLVGEQRGSALGLVYRLFNKLPVALRRKFVLISCATVLGAVLEIMMLGAVIPFLTVLAAPGEASTYLHRFGLHGSLAFGSPSNIAAMVTATFATFALCAGVTRLCLSKVTSGFVYAVSRALSSEVFRISLGRDYADHVRDGSADMLTIVQDARTLASNVLLPVMQASSAAVFGALIVAFLTAINPMAAVALGLIGGVYMLMSLALRGRLKGESVTVSRAARGRVRAVQDALGGIREIILDETQAHFLGAYVRLDRTLTLAQASIAFLSSAPRIVIESIGILMIAAVGFYFNGRTGGLLKALPSLAALALGAQRLLPLMQQGYSAATQVLGNWDTVGRLLTALEQPVEPADLQPSLLGAELCFERSLGLRGVWFRYTPDGPDVVCDLTLAIAKGSRVGIAGRSGSGKSTVADLILGLATPSMGAVLIDGRPLTREVATHWRRHVAHVPQTVFLADTSIARNIAFGRDDEEIDMARVRAAAASAQIADFVEGLPEGFETRVGERGAWLSGGQRQRVGIARALYKRASLLVLDEATSALDTATEAAVIEAVQALSRDITIIVIAHRESAMTFCETILRLDEGALVEQRGPATPVRAEAT